MAAGANKLIDIAHQLQCAGNSGIATDTLSKLRGNIHPDLLLPNELGNHEYPFSLHAGTMDVLLQSLISTSSKFPTTRANVEKTLLQWNYCGLIEDDQLFDYLVLDKKLKRAIVDYQSPADWDGFRSLGLLDTQSERFRFSSFEYGDVPHLFYEQRYHQLFRQKCLPHPVHGKLFIDKDTYFPQRLSVHSDTITHEFPYNWSTSCNLHEDTSNHELWYTLEKKSIDQMLMEQLAVKDLSVEHQPPIDSTADKLSTLIIVSEVTNNTPAEVREYSHKSGFTGSSKSQTGNDRLTIQSSEINKTGTNTEDAIDGITIRFGSKSQPSIAPDRHLSDVISIGTALSSSRAADTKEIVKNVATKSLETKVLIEQETTNKLTETEEPIELSKLADTDKPTDTEEPNDATDTALSTSYGLLVTSESNAKTDDSNSKPRPENSTVGNPGLTSQAIGSSRVIESDTLDKSTKEKKLGISGFFNISNRSFEENGFSIVGSLSYKPIKKSYWFMRASWKLQNADKPLTYSWGIGYDDWHKKTWSVQLNHWGPLKPGSGFDEKNAIGSISYNFGSPFLSKYKLGSSASLSKKLSGDPIFTWGVSWSPHPKWFIRTNFSKNLTGGNITWAYGIGYANYSPFTWSLEYNNWGLNKALEDNFKDNGIVTLTYRWSF